MLYDTRWDAKVETKADPFRLESLIAWLEKQPADEQYCYADNGRCLLAQYFRAAGFDVWLVGGYNFAHYPTPADRLVGRYTDTRFSWTFNEVSLDQPWTYGAALERARKLAAQ